MLGFLNTGNVVKFHPGFGLHGKTSLGFAELHRLAGAPGHAIAAAGQEHQDADQEQREQQVAQQAEGRWSLTRRVDVEADALLLEIVDQLRC